MSILGNWLYYQFKIADVELECILQSSLLRPMKRRSWNAHTWAVDFMGSGFSKIYNTFARKCCCCCCRFLVSGHSRKLCENQYMFPVVTLYSRQLFLVASKLIMIAEINSSVPETVALWDLIFRYLTKSGIPVLGAQLLL